jgi:hypothetical protein
VTSISRIPRRRAGLAQQRFDELPRLGMRAEEHPVRVAQPAVALQLQDLFEVPEGLDARKHGDANHGGRGVERAQL